MVIAKHAHYEDHGLSSQPETATSFLFFWLGDPAGTLHMCLFYTVVYSSAKPHTVERVQCQQRIDQQGVGPTSTFV